MKEEKRLTKPTMQRALLVFVAVVIVISAVMLYHDYLERQITDNKKSS